MHPSVFIKYQGRAAALPLPLIVCEIYTKKDNLKKYGCATCSLTTFPFQTPSITGEIAWQERDGGARETLVVEGCVAAFEKLLRTCFLVGTPKMALNK
jgi:hypothetical protein